MMKLVFTLILLLESTNALLNSKSISTRLLVNTRLESTTSEAVIKSSTIVKDADYETIIPYLSEHIQLSDQLLFVGASTNLALLLSKNGYGTKKTGFITCIDEDPIKIQECIRIANEDPDLQKNVKNNKLLFKTCNLSNMPEICKQSVFDAIVDYAGIDSLHQKHSTSTSSETKANIEPILQCIDHLQNSLRLGNILVCLSYLDKKQFCHPFEQRFGWVQELDGDPGEISAWYRGKTNIQASISSFSKLGLQMYVYTNTDNC